MKLVTILVLVAAPLLAVSPGQLNAQSTWIVVDDFQPVSKSRARAGGLCMDPSNTILCSAGYSAIDPTDSGEIGVIRGSADAGTTWATLDTWQSEWPYAYAEFDACCWAAPSPVLTSGALFAAGHTFTENTSSASVDWIIRRSIFSMDGIPGTWTTQDIVEDKAVCVTIQAAPSGDLYAAGFTNGYSINGGSVWLVRKSSDGGDTWHTVDWVGGDTGTKRPGGIAFGPSGSVLVAGTLMDSKGIYHWIVRRSTDGGTTWATVDSYQASKNDSAQAQDIATDASGTLYVAGLAKHRQKGRFTDLWVVRRSTDDGSTWSIVDSLALAVGTLPYSMAYGPTAIAVAPSGQLLVCGYMTASDGSSQWLVRQGIPGARGAISWTTIDNYQMATGQSARANGVAADIDGNIFVSGRAADDSGTDHWLTRKLAAP